MSKSIIYVWDGVSYLATLPHLPNKRISNTKQNATTLAAKIYDKTNGNAKKYLRQIA